MHMPSSSGDSCRIHCHLLHACGRQEDAAVCVTQAADQPILHAQPATSSAHKPALTCERSRSAPVCSSMGMAPLVLLDAAQPFAQLAAWLNEQQERSQALASAELAGSSEAAGLLEDLSSMLSSARYSLNEAVERLPRALLGLVPISEEQWNSMIDADCGDSIFVNSDQDVRWPELPHRFGVSCSLCAELYCSELCPSLRTQ